MQVFCGSHFMLIGLWILILSQARGTDGQVYKWSCSALQVNTTPNYYTLPDLRGIEGSIIPSSFNEISIYPLPPMLNCSGTVSGVGYCYRVFTYQRGTEQLVFTLLTLEQNRLTNSLRVTNIIPVRSIPTRQRCYSVLFGTHMQYFCCDQFTLGTVEQFHLPAANFAFGIIVTATSYRLLAFHPLFSVRVEHHRLSTEELGSLAVGDMISVDSTTSDRALRLFSFYIIPTDEQPTSEMMPSTTINVATVAAGTATTPRVTTRDSTTTSSPPTMAVTDATTAGATAEFATTSLATDATTAGGTSDTPTMPEVDTTTVATDAITAGATDATTGGSTDATTAGAILDSPTIAEVATTSDARGTDATTTRAAEFATTGGTDATTGGSTDATTTRAAEFATTGGTDATTDTSTMAEVATTARATDSTIAGGTDSTIAGGTDSTTAGATESTTAGPTTSGATDTPTMAGSGGTTLIASTIGVDTTGNVRTSGGDFPSEAPSAVGGRDNGDGSSIVGAVVGGVVGVGVAVVLLVAIVVCVVAAMLKGRNKLYRKLDRGGNISYPNAVYGSDEQYETVRSDYIGIEPHSYSDIGEVAAVDHPSFYEQVSETQSHEYSYAESNIRAELIDDTYEAVAQLSVREQSMEPFSPESIYQRPGGDENTLYAQLNEIQTDNITRDNVLLGDFLGSGQFGTVHKGVWQSYIRGSVKVAVKTLKEGSGEKDRVKFLQEAAILGQFKHPNVVEMYGVVTQGEPILLVLELLAKGDLRDYLLHMRADEEGGVSVDDHTLLSYCRQVASGMAYLSSKAFVHRDLAARNILVSDDNICKIADFGMSRDLMDESYYVSHGGKIPVKWTAPEALHYKKYSTASDVWSYGVLMYEIWSLGHKPFENLANKRVLELVDTGYRLPPPPACPRALYAIMISCWHPETPERPCFADICNQLSLPDAELLKWTEEDKSTHPEVDKLGADLLFAQDLCMDLQVMYKHNRT